jgi:8-oxo-dGTP pyrophosphatase MutT (NUDIX family)
MKNRTELIRSIGQYQTEFIEESPFREQFLELLEHPRAFFRDNLPGHITGSAWIVDETKQYTLLTHHAKLNRWLQPGGHADGDENIVNVALREAKEETGLADFKILIPEIFDLDIHIIPQRKNFPEHLHFDIRILMGTSKENKLIVTEESHDLAWVAIGKLDAITGNNRSITRMAEKLQKLF